VDESGVSDDSSGASLKAVAAAHAAGRLDAARAMCERLLDADPRDGDAHMWRGLISMSELRWSAAAAAFEAALAIRIEPWSFGNLGACYLKLGRLDDAGHRLRRALELKPDLLGAHITLATVLHGLRQFDAALAQLDQAARIKSNDAEVESRRGCSLLELDRYDEAQHAFQRAAAGAADFVYARLASFDRATYESITRSRRTIAPPEPATPANRAGARGVVLVSCNPDYARKYGMPFLRSYAEHAQAHDLLHLHIVDADARIVDEMLDVAARSGLDKFAVTVEESPFPVHEVQRRRAYYACARLLHLPYWLESYKLPILSLDVDFIVESPVEVLFESVAGHDMCLNARRPIDSPWLDVIANVIVANPTPRAREFFEGVANYAHALLEREPKAWLVDQTSLYCVLKMRGRFGSRPSVKWLPQAHQSGLWHIGHGYDYLLEDPRFRRYANA
jgi:tetratricopeptide (TPR) repeat protein